MTEHNVMDNSVEHFFEHYGVKGMKWGVIRDHLAARSAARTAKAEKVFRESVKKATARESVQRDQEKIGRVRERDKQKELLDFSSSNDHKTAAFVKKKAKISGVNTLSNSDLQTLITRMNLERQFKDLKQVEHAESYVGKGKKWAANFATDVLKDAASSWLKRPGSNFSGRTSARAGDYAWGYGQQVAGALGESITRRAIGS